MGKEIAKRLKLLRQELELSQTDLAAVLGIRQASYSAIERGKVSVSAAMLVKLNQQYRVDINWLLLGQGQPFMSTDQAAPTPETGFSTPGIGTDLQAVTDYARGYSRNRLSQIRLVSKEMQPQYCTSRDEPGFLQSLESINLPITTKDNLRAFQMATEELKPIIKQGDYLIVKQAEAVRFVQPQSVCVVVLEDKVIIRRIDYTGAKPKDVVLEADHDFFKPITVPIAEIREIWTFQQRLTSQLDLPQDFFSATQLNGILLQLKK